MTQSSEERRFVGQWTPEVAEAYKTRLGLHQEGCDCSLCSDAEARARHNERARSLSRAEAEPKMKGAPAFSFVSPARPGEEFLQ